MKIFTVYIAYALVFNQMHFSAGIYSGTRAAKGQYPFAVNILHYFVDISNRTDKVIVVYRHTCSGSILSKDYVLTAAGCFQQLIKHHNKSESAEMNLTLTQDTPVYLRAGIIDKPESHAEGFQERRGENLIVHPDFVNQSTMFDVDVALIKLKTPWNLTADPTQVAIAPPLAERINALDYLKCYVVGFGFTSVEEYMSGLFSTVVPALVNGNVLRYYVARVGRERYCRFLRNNLGNLGEVRVELFDDFYVCALRMNKTVRQGACYGDMGGPLICNGLLTAVMSQTRSKSQCFEKPGENMAFAIFTSVGAEEVITFLRSYVPDIPKLKVIPPGNPFEDY